MGNGRVWDAAAFDGKSHAAGIEPWEAVGTDAGNSTDDWANFARGDGLEGVGRTNCVAGLRRDSSGWRDADGFRDRGVRGLGVVAGADGGGGNFAQGAVDGFFG